MLHLLITLLTGACLYPLNLHLEAVTMASLFYIGREHAQAEYRAINTHYNGHRVNAPWWCGFEPRAWNKKSVLDWLLPVLLTIVVYLVRYVGLI